MHIVLGLLGAIGTVAFLLWRINMAAHATSELMETASDARKWFRRKRWQGKSTYHALKDVHDPREAAAAMMVAVATCDGAMSDRERTNILQSMKTIFDIEENVALALLARANWLAQNSLDLSYFLKQLAPSVERICSPAEKRQLIAMLKMTASVDTHMDSVAEQAIMELKRRFGL